MIKNFRDSNLDLIRSDLRSNIRLFERIYFLINSNNHCSIILSLERYVVSFDTIF